MMVRMSCDGRYRTCEESWDELTAVYEITVHEI